MAMYDAFISYSHAKDKPIAAALQSVIQKLGKPWYRRRALRVFRDDTSLSATPHLWPAIEQALGQSRYFILLASPQAAQSKWVSKEVAFWLENNGTDTFFVGVTDGELAWDDALGDFARSENFPLPPVLAARFATEPKWVDLRAFRDQADMRNSRFIELGADFAAAIHGIPKEDLLSQEVRQQRRLLTLAWSAVAALVVLAGLAGWQWREAVTQKQRAQQMLAQATATTNSLVYDLARRFRDAGLPTAIVKDILDRARALQEELVDAGQTTPDLKRSEGRALLESVKTLRTVGDTAGALSAARRALRLFQEAGTAGGADADDHSRNIALSFGFVADVLFDQGDLDGALRNFRAAFEILQRLDAAESKLRETAAASSPREPAFDLDRYRLHRSDLAVAYGRIGNVLKEQGKLDEALANLSANLELRKQLAAFDAKDTHAQRQLAISYSTLGSLLEDFALSYHKAGDAAGANAKIEEALKNHRESLAILQRLSAAEPGNTASQRDLAVAYDKVAEMLAAQRKFEDSLKLYQKDLGIIERLAASDRSNSGWQYDLAMSYAHVSDLFKIQNKPDEALVDLRKELSVLETLVAAKPTNAEWQRSVTFACLAIATIELAQNKLDGAYRGLRDCVTLQRLDTPSPDDWARRSAAEIGGRIGTLSFRFLLAQNFAEALKAADQSIALDPAELWLYTNRAHALMLLGRVDEARSLYLRHSRKLPAAGAKSWEALVLDDFANLRRAGIRHPLMDEIEVKFSAGG